MAVEEGVLDSAGCPVLVENAVTIVGPFVNEDFAFRTIYRQVNIILVKIKLINTWFSVLENVILFQ